MKNPVQSGFPRFNVDQKYFVDLTMKLIDSFVEFSLFTLRTFSKRKKIPLTLGQIRDVIDFDLQFRLQQVQDPEFLSIIRERASQVFLKELKKSFLINFPKKVNFRLER